MAAVGKRRVLLAANCTNRKRRAAGEPFRLREVEGAESPSERARLWWEALNRHHSDTELPAIDLYVGGHWSVVRQLPDALEALGFSTELLVLSAGYGLIPADEEIKSYSATFSRPAGEDGAGALKDWVVYGAPAQNSAALSEWWEALSRETGRSLARAAEDSPDAALIIIASVPYLEAIALDLEQAIEQLNPDANGEKTCLIFCVGTPRSFPESLEPYLVPATARLEPILATKLGSEGRHSPGARQALGANMFRYLLLEAEKNRKLRQFQRGAVREHFKQLAESPAAQLPSFDRVGNQSDDSVLLFIEERLEDDASLSASGLLREFRDSGRRCEQKRFHRLFRNWRETQASVHS